MDITDASLNVPTNREIIVDGTGTTGNQAQTMTFPALPGPMPGETSAKLTATASSGLAMKYLVIRARDDCGIELELYGSGNGGSGGYSVR
jgi:hypothetical protein